MTPANVDEGLKQFASATQSRYIDAVIEHGSMRAAARALGVNFTSVRKGIETAKAKAAARGYSPEHHLTRPIAPGLRMRGTSQLFKAGQAAPVLEWVKTSADAEEQEAIVRAFITELCQDAKGKAPLIAPPSLVNSELLAVYPVGDHHHGMYADPTETGDAYDAKISVNRLESAFDHLVSLAPPAETALLINLGDFMHANTGDNATASGTRLDVDTRFGKVLVSGAMSLVRCVLKLLQKHKTVHVWNMRGNHDTDASLALAIGMKFYFHNEQRVIVDMGTSLYKYHRFGEVLIGSHHGHGAKPQDLPLIMAEDRKADWGVTNHRVWHCGHVHHLTRKDYTGVTVETHRTLAGTDAWHAGQGYRSKKDMNAIIYHSRFGEIQRTRFEMAMAEG
ncbi:MAG: hypothetical protein ACM32J_17255 [Rhizobacter sp.]